ncbi:MAG: glycosyltransferase family 39 protein [Acidobacteriia bacterium]|nr:glycosyltransferase family 39 protein [Terriglobia bacterium]
MPTSSARPQPASDTWQSAILLLLCFAALLVTHFPILRLPYFWDESGYYIPAARDLLLSGSPIPHSTLSNAHPPLLMAYLAAAWKVFGYSPQTTRAAMLLVAAFTLLGIYRLARRVANTEVALASVVCTALYPVFFSQSAMAHLDLAAACLIIWGLGFYLDQRTVPAIIFFALACLTKETAVLAPLALLLWQLVASAIVTRSSIFNSVGIKRSTHRPIARSLSLVLAIVPVGAWFALHYARTGYVFGNPEYFRYNLASTLNPLRFFAALALRLWHLLGYMNMFLLTFATALAMFLPPQRDPGRARRTAGGNGEPEIARRAIARDVQTVFYVLILVHVVALSILGGAVLARYLLPVYPLLVILCVSTLRRRVPWWRAFVAIICAGFVISAVINPPYRFAPEDNLAWSDYVRLHQSAGAYVAQHHPEGRVLTAWPATDELSHPWLGYVPHAVPIVAMEDFSAPQVLAAADARSQYRAALVFSTKYEPRYLLRLPGWERLQERFFGYHRDLPPELIARMLGARVVFEQHRGQQWVAVLQLDTVENARLRGLAPTDK